MADSVFTKIIKGEIPCHKVYEDNKTIAFLPLHMAGKGHVLVVPKVQIDHFQNLPDDYYDAVWQTVKKVAMRMKDVLRTKRVGVQIIGLDVPHAHIHVIAFDNLNEYVSIPDDLSPVNDEQLAQMAKKLAF